MKIYAQNLCESLVYIVRSDLQEQGIDALTSKESWNKNSRIFLKKVQLDLIF